MPWLTLIPLLALFAGCAAVTPHFDTRFGDAVREARQLQTRDLQAGQWPDEVTGMDGVAARETLRLYQGTFKEPPAVVNVINIGGMAGGK
jgi:hypothetical protein